MTALTCTTTVLINKGRGEYIGIGLVGFIWKVCVSIMDNRIWATITFHDALHGFRQVRGEATAIMKVKLD